MHKHKAKSEKVKGFQGPVVGIDDQNPAAHGGVCHVETCACGAQRETNANGRHVERGFWQQAKGGR